MDFMAIYGEAGMIGVVGVMFVYLVVSMSKKSDSQQKTLEDLKVENRGQSETLANLTFQGVHFHLGSPIFELSPIITPFSMTENAPMVTFLPILAFELTYAFSLTPLVY